MPIPMYKRKNSPDRINYLLSIAEEIISELTKRAIIYLKMKQIRKTILK